MKNTNVLTVIYFSEWQGKRIVNNGLVDALLQAGIPREQIVLAYAGEATDSGYQLMEK